VGLRDDLIRYLRAPSDERAPIIADVATRNMRLADLLVSFETHDHVRVEFETELLSEEDGDAPN
jgi:hypothetical protein